jgi:hypothetical protein
MPNNNNNILTEISALVLAALLIIAGVVLLYVGKIDYSNAIFFFISALGLFGFNSAWKAPSPTQQNQIAAIATQQSATISQMVSQQAAPVQATPVEMPQAVQLPSPPPLPPAPVPMFTAQVPQPPVQFMQPPQASTSYVPPQPIPFDGNWSNMVTSQTTLPQVPTP